MRKAAQLRMLSALAAFRCDRSQDEGDISFVKAKVGFVRGAVIERVKMLHICSNVRFREAALQRPAWSWTTALGRECQRLDCHLG